MITVTQISMTMIPAMVRNSLTTKCNTMLLQLDMSATKLTVAMKIKKPIPGSSVTKQLALLWAGIIRKFVSLATVIQSPVVNDAQ